MHTTAQNRTYLQHLSILDLAVKNLEKSWRITRNCFTWIKKGKKKRIGPWLDSGCVIEGGNDKICNDVRQAKDWLIKKTKTWRDAFLQH